MSLSQQLKILAKGINPDTGELLNKGSIANSVEGVRFLFLLAEEINDYEEPKKRKNKLTPEQRREKNIAEGKPPKSHFPWSDEGREKLKNEFDGLDSVIGLAEKFERSPLAIAVQLEKLSLISEEDLEIYRDS